MRLKCPKLKLKMGKKVTKVTKAGVLYGVK